MTETATLIDLQRRINETPKAIIGAKVKEAREAVGLSHDKLGKAVGAWRPNLIKLEQGKHRPGAPLLLAIANETGHDPEWFLAGDEVDEAPFRPGRDRDAEGSGEGPDAGEGVAA